MDRAKLILYAQTIRHLRVKQIYYQFYYRIRNMFFRKKFVEISSIKIQKLAWDDYVFNPVSFKGSDEFEFLNLTCAFENGINWNYSEYGKLWTYNLNYFDFLNQKDFSVEDGLPLIKNYVENNDILKDGLEPYPVSLRGINWIKFLSRNNIIDNDINAVLYQHYVILTKNLEYHLMANHLLENGFSLYFGAYYFKDNNFYTLAKKIVLDELNEQILVDGAHFELSPMYHQIILYRLLDCINLSRLNNWQKDELQLVLRGKAIQMLGWLQRVTYSNGSIPMVNDSAFGIAPSSDQLFAYAKSLNLKWSKSQLGDSGYRKFKNDNYELFIDVGEIGPKYQPGHAHSDTFNFELYVDNNPVIVDAGISTYEKNDLRQLQRSTVSHNTVKIGNYDQTEVWGGFRVGKRAKIVSLREDENFIEASHDGYKKLGCIHTRSFKATMKAIIITDSLSKASSEKQSAYLHFHPDVSDVKVLDNEIKLTNQQISIKVDNAKKINRSTYEYALGYNRTKTAVVVEIEFDRKMQIEIDLP